MAQLTGTQKKQLQGSILDAFEPNDLEQLLVFALDKRLDNIAAPGPFPQVALAVIEAAEKEGWTAGLIRALAEERPGRADLQERWRELLAAVEGHAQPPPAAPDPAALRRALTQLRQALAARYALQGDQRTLLFDAGLDESRITFTGQADNDWRAILVEAQGQGQLNEIIGLAVGQYPADRALADAVKAYQDASGA